MSSLGIIQGRLTPMRNSLIQSFPVEKWESEFTIAADIGYEIIEWVIDSDSLKSNPLYSESGRRKISKIQKASGVRVPSVCCDFFMDHQVHKKTLDSYSARGMLFELCRICPEVGIRKIEIPLIGSSSLRTVADKTEMIRLFEHIYPILEAQNLIILIETDLGPTELFDFLERVNTDRIKVNYDMGNSAYWGFNSENEISLYGKYIGNVHIKDCTPARYSVELGQGDVDFDSIFSSLKKGGYRGDFVIQGARARDDVEIAKTYEKFSRDHINKFF